MNSIARSSVSSVSYAESPGEGAHLRLGNHSPSHFLTAREFQNVYLRRGKPSGQPLENPAAEIPSTPVLPQARTRSGAVKKRSRQRYGAMAAAAPTEGGRRAKGDSSYLSVMLQQHSANTAKIYDGVGNPVVSMNELLHHRVPLRDTPERPAPSKAAAYIDFGSAATAAWGAASPSDNKGAPQLREEVEDQRRRNSLPQQLRDRVASAPLEGNLPLVRLLRAELETQRSKIEQLEKDVDKYKSIVEESEALAKEGEKSSNVQLRRKIVLLQRRLSDMTAQIENLKRINRASNARELTIALQAAEAEIQRLRNGSAATAAAHTPAARTPSAKSNDQREERHIEQLRAQNLHLMAEVKEIASIKCALEASLTEAQQQLTEKTAEIHEVHAYAKQIASQYGEAVAQALQDRAALKQVVVENEFLGKEVEVLRRLPQEVTHLKAELESLRVALAHHEGQASRLKKSVEEAKKPDPAVAFLQEDKTRLVALLRQKNVQESSLRDEIAQLRHYQSSATDMKSTVVLEKEKLLSKDREKYLLGVIASLREQADKLAREVEEQKQERLRDLEEAQEREEDDLIQKILEKRPTMASTVAGTPTHSGGGGTEEGKEGQKEKKTVVPPVAPQIEPLPLDDDDDEEDTYTPVGTPLKQTPRAAAQKPKSPSPSLSSSSSPASSSPLKSESGDEAASDQIASSDSSPDKEEKDSNSTISSPPLSKTSSSLSEEELPSITKERDNVNSLSASHNTDDESFHHTAAGGDKRTTPNKKVEKAEEEEEEEEISSAENSYLESNNKETPKTATGTAPATATTTITTTTTTEHHALAMDLPKAPTVVAPPTSILVSRDAAKAVDLAPPTLRATVYSPSTTEDRTAGAEPSESSSTESTFTSSTASESAPVVPPPPPPAVVPVPSSSASKHPSAAPVSPRPHPPEERHTPSSVVAAVEPELAPHSPPMANRIENPRAIPSPPTAVAASLQEILNGSPQLNSVLKSLHGTEEVQWKGVNASNLVSELYHQYSGDASFDFFEPLAARYRKEEEEQQGRYGDRVLAESGQGQLATMQSRSMSSKEMPTSAPSQSSEEKNGLGDVNVLSPPQNRLHASPEPSPIRQASGEATQMSLGEDFRAMVSDDSKVHLSATALPHKVVTSGLEDSVPRPAEPHAEVPAADMYEGSPEEEKEGKEGSDKEEQEAFTVAIPKAVVPAPPKVVVPEEPSEAKPPSGEFVPVQDDTSSTHTAPYDMMTNPPWGGSGSYTRHEGPRRDGASPPISEDTHVGEEERDDESSRQQSPGVPLPALPPPPSPPIVKSIVEAVAPAAEEEKEGEVLPAPMATLMEEQKEEDAASDESAPGPADATKNEEEASVMPEDLPPLPPPPFAVVPEPPSPKEDDEADPHSGDLMGSLSLSATTPEEDEVTPGKKDEKANRGAPVAGGSLGLPPLPPMVAVPLPPPSTSDAAAAAAAVEQEPPKQDADEDKMPVPKEVEEEVAAAPETSKAAAPWPPLPPKFAVPPPPPDASLQADDDAPPLEMETGEDGEADETKQTAEDKPDAPAAALGPLPLPPMVAVPQPPPAGASTDEVKEAEEETKLEETKPEERVTKAPPPPPPPAVEKEREESHHSDDAKDSSLELEDSSDGEDDSVNSADTLDPK